jgi:tRNA modification GTPase
MSVPRATIVAISSPPGSAARGLLRLSGPLAHDILGAWTCVPIAPRVLTPIRVSSGPFSIPALALTFVSPRSFTGEPMAELQLPGNPALLERFVHDAVVRGARLAEPGEFTFRAYLARKIDLTQAEGIAATISATSDAQLAAASLLREGALGRAANALVDSIATQLALVESGIDFVDQDDVVPIRPGPLHQNLSVIVASIEQTLSSSRSWGQLQTLPAVVLVGAPSTGKSTLFNALLGRTRAVISPTPGTTRDVLSEPLSLVNPHGRAVEVMLTDIAGLDLAESRIDRMAQDAANRAIHSADLLLLITDGVTPVSPDRLASASPQTPRLHIRTKSDLKGTGPFISPVLPVSSLTGEGLPALRAAILAALADRAVSIQSDMLALQPRHEHALRTALAQCRLALDALAHQRDRPSIEHPELVAAALREALDQLACLGGEMTPDDIIGRVFATFCVGK